MKTPNTPEDENEDLSEDEELLQAFADAVNEEDIEAQEEAALAFFRQALEKQDTEPNPWLDAMGEAHQYEAKFDWISAEEAYKRAIEATSDKPMLQSKAYTQLAALYTLVGLDTLAMEAIQQASESTRASEMEILIALQLQQEAEFHLKAKDFPRAKALIDEAFTYIEDDPMHDLQRAYALTTRANYHSQQGNISEAEENLATAWKILEPHAESYFFAGWQSGLAQWWIAKALLHTRQENLAEAVTCWHSVVERRRIISQLPQLEGPYKHNGVALSLRNLGKALRQIGDESAETYFVESHTIRRTIGLPPLEE